MNAKRILVLEDDEGLRVLIVALLQREFSNVNAAASASAARVELSRGDVNLLVLDLNLPDGDGVALCRQLRAEEFDGAIIMVTARATPVERVLGLELGADDYLIKPFEPMELLARVRNLLKRQGSSPCPQRASCRIARFGSWRLDLRLRRLINSVGHVVMLSASEFELLLQFVSAPDKVLSREHLAGERMATASFDRTIDLRISRLRHKLEGEMPESIILTVRNKGYVMPGPVTFE